MQTLKIFGNIYCSAKLTRGVQNQIIYLSVIYILLGITAVVGNTLILIALHNETSLHQPSKVFIAQNAATYPGLLCGVRAEIKMQL